MQGKKNEHKEQDFCCKHHTMPLTVPCRPRQRRYKAGVTLTLGFLSAEGLYKCLPEAHCLPSPELSTVLEKSPPPLSIKVSALWYVTQNLFHIKKLFLFYFSVRATAALCLLLGLHPNILMSQLFLSPLYPVRLPFLRPRCLVGKKSFLCILDLTFIPSILPSSFSLRDECLPWVSSVQALIVTPFTMLSYR